MKKIIRIGTRGSPLAMVQAEEIQKKVFLACGGSSKDLDIQIIPIRTSGDWKPEQNEQRFIELGGNKGFFTKEIEEALLARHIDVAVHSMKDVESHVPDGLEIAAVLERLDPRDAFISAKAQTLSDLPAGSVVGTSSLRRQAQILILRPDLRVAPLRGNVDTRLKKLESGIADATLLAVAGLMRLGMNDRIASILETDVMLPSAAQGALGIEIRKDDKDIKSILQSLNHPLSFACVMAERACLKILDGNCKTPIGALAQVGDNDVLALDVLVARPDGTASVRLQHKGSVANAEAIGIELGHRLKVQIPTDFFVG